MKYEQIPTDIKVIRFEPTELNIQQNIHDILDFLNNNKTVIRSYVIYKNINDIIGFDTALGEFKINQGDWLIEQDNNLYVLDDIAFNKKFRIKVKIDVKDIDHITEVLSDDVVTNVKNKNISNRIKTILVDYFVSKHLLPRKTQHRI